MLSLFEILLASISAIVGSGWLFAASYTYEIAGKFSVISWILGAVLALLIAFIFAEICTMIPISGSSARIPYCTHGLSISAIFALIVWLGYIMYVPTETQATIQYLSVFFPSLVNPLTEGLSKYGYLLATLMIMAYMIVSIYSTKWLLKANSIITVLKIVIPVIVSLYIVLFFLLNHQPTHQIIHINKGSISGMFTAISMGGIFFAFNGFKMAAELAGDTRNPSKTIPIAIIGSIGITLVLYILLQYAFNTYIYNSAQAVTNIVVGVKSGPFASIGLSRPELRFIIPLIYLGAIVAPCAAGIVYFVSSTKTLKGLVDNGYLPKHIGFVNKRDNPVFIILFNFLFAISIFLFIHGWNATFKGEVQQNKI